MKTRNANTDIYVMNPDGSGGRRLTTDPALDEFPTWSPDGTTIAYDSSGSTTLDSFGFSPTQEIWSVPATGGSPRQLTHDLVPDQAPTYSPDGRQIAFFHNGSIWVMGASGGAINPISGNTQVFATTPRWSPDGTRIAVLGYPGPNLRGTIADPRDGGRITSLPRATVDILEVSSGHVTHLSVPVLTSTNAVSWMPSGDALLVDRFTP